MQKLHMIICDAGDGSNYIRWVMDPAVLDKMQELADDGDDCYASGDGLQVRHLQFPDEFDINAWMQLNYLSLTELSDFE